DGAREQHRRLTEADDRDVHGAATFGESGFLEMADHEGVVAGTFGLQRGTNCLLGAAELGDWMEITVRWRDAVHVHSDARRGKVLQSRAQPIDIRRLLGGIDEALVPHSRRSLSAHRRSGGTVITIITACTATKQR